MDESNLIINDSLEDQEDGYQGRNLSPTIHMELETELGVSPPDDLADGSNRTLLTFGGVFCPVSLSMFSAILFLRLGFILGNSGLYLTILELLLAYTILIFTVLSICAISTNEAIKGGGAYFMISRALGPELGGSIGTLFFIANVFSSALYLTGCIEGILNNFGPSGSISSLLPSSYWWSILYGSTLNFMNMIICLVGATLFAKTSVTIFFVVILITISVIVSFVSQTNLPVLVPLENTIFNRTETNVTLFTGLSMDTFYSNLQPHFSMDYTTHQITSFPVIFGVLFSGVTGIMAGANISGELKDPAKSIPKGTIIAVAFTFVIYLFLFFVTSATCPRELLLNDYLYMQSVDYLPVLVAIGIFAATFSASLSNLIGASRVLAALADDQLFGLLLHPIKRYTMLGNPVAAVITTWFMIQCILFINKLNLIAQITSIFFLLTYFATNLACLALTLTSAPNFRPTFKYFTGKTATIGLLGCLIMMFVINSVYSAITIILCLILIIVLHFRSPPVRWGHITQALIFHQVRKYLLILDSRKDHVKYWRPHILLMVANPRSSIPLIQFANDLKKSGLFLIGHVKLGSLDNYQVDPIVDEYPLWLKLFDMLAVKAFFEVTLANTVREGFHHVIRMTGLGAMKPNTIFFGFYDEEPQLDFLRQHPNYESIKKSGVNDNEFLSLRVDGQRNLNHHDYLTLIYESIFKFKKNVCIGRYFNFYDKESLSKHCNKRIDIWPINFFSPHKDLPGNSWQFLLQLTCILQMVPGWKNSTKLRLFVTDQFESNGSVHDHWNKRLKEMRIRCKIEVINWDLTVNPSNLDIYSASPEEKDVYFKSVNQCIHFHSGESSVVFLYLPPPSIQEQRNVDYLHNLTEMTNELPPTILVHGITKVVNDN